MWRKVYFFFLFSYLSVLQRTTNEVWTSLICQLQCTICMIKQLQHGYGTKSSLLSLALSCCLWKNKWWCDEKKLKPHKTRKPSATSSVMQWWAPSRPRSFRDTTKKNVYCLWQDNMKQQFPQLLKGCNSCFEGNISIHKTTVGECKHVSHMCSSKQTGK